VEILFDFLERPAPRLGNPKRHQRGQRHDAGEHAQHAFQADRIGRRPECECGQQGARLAGRGGYAVRGASDARGEDLRGDEERRRIGSHVEHELRDGEDRDQPGRRRVVGYARPDRVQDCHGDAAPELLPYAAHQVRQEDSDVEARQIACEGHDDVAHRGVVQCLPGCGALGVADFAEDDALVEVDAVVGDVTGGRGCLSIAAGLRETQDGVERHGGGLRLTIKTKTCLWQIVLSRASTQRSTLGNLAVVAQGHACRHR
jgi:hypothetical protein